VSNVDTALLLQSLSRRLWLAYKSVCKRALKNKSGIIRVVLNVLDIVD